MIRRSTLLTTLLAASTGLALFVVKYQVQDMEDNLTEINREIAGSQKAIHVLKAEWSHLNEPNRLRFLAVRHLGMGPMENAQFTRTSDLSGQLPPRQKAKTFDQKIGNALKKDVSQ